MNPIRPLALAVNRAGQAATVAATFSELKSQPRKGAVAYAAKKTYKPPEIVHPAIRLDMERTEVICGR